MLCLKGRKRKRDLLLAGSCSILLHTGWGYAGMWPVVWNYIQVCHVGAAAHALGPSFSLPLPAHAH